MRAVASVRTQAAHGSLQRSASALRQPLIAARYAIRGCRASEKASPSGGPATARPLTRCTQRRRPAAHGSSRRGLRVSAVVAEPPAPVALSREQAIQQQIRKSVASLGQRVANDADLRSTPTQRCASPRRVPAIVATASRGGGFETSGRWVAEEQPRLRGATSVAEGSCGARAANAASSAASCATARPPRAEHAFLPRAVLSWRPGERCRRLHCSPAPHRCMAALRPWRREWRCSPGMCWRTSAPACSTGACGTACHATQAKR